MYIYIYIYITFFKISFMFTAFTGIVVLFSWVYGESVSDFSIDLVSNLVQRCSCSIHIEFQIKILHKCFEIL